MRYLAKHPRRRIRNFAAGLIKTWKNIIIEETAQKKVEPVNVDSSKEAIVDSVKKSSQGKHLKVELGSPRPQKLAKTERGPVERQLENGNCSADNVEVERRVDHQKLAAQAPPKLTSMIKCGDSTRDRNRELLLEALSKVVTEADGSIKENVAACDPVRVAVSVESVLFDMWGGSLGAQKFKYRSILFNIRDTKNPDFRRKVLLGDIKPERIINLTAEEMASDQRQLEIKQIQKKALTDCELGGPPKASTDQFKCGRCGQRKCTYYQMQTRSPDEPMTTFVTCVNCNKHWKFC